MGDLVNLTLRRKYREEDRRREFYVKTYAAVKEAGLHLGLDKKERREGRIFRASRKRFASVSGMSRQAWIFIENRQHLDIVKEADHGAVEYSSSQIMETIIYNMSVTYHCLCSYANFQAKSVSTRLCDEIGNVLAYWAQIENLHILQLLLRKPQARAALLISVLSIGYEMSPP